MGLKVGSTRKRSGGAIAALLSSVHFTIPLSLGSLDVPVCLSLLPPSTPSPIFVQVWGAQLNLRLPRLFDALPLGSKANLFGPQPTLTARIAALSEFRCEPESPVGLFPSHISLS